MILSIYIIFIVSKVKCSILFNKKYYFPILRHEVSQHGLVKDVYQEGKETCLGTSTAELPVGLCSQLKLSGTSKD